jgi:inositol transport system substrate-binding protein
MQEVCKIMGGKGNILVLMGELSNQAARQRTQDIHDVIAKPECAGIKIVEEQTGNWDRTQGTDLMTNWISSGVQFDAVVSNNDEMAIGAIQALKAAGVDLNKVIVAGVDATQDALAAMKAGELDVTVFQNAAAQGSGAVDTALKLAKGESVESMVWVPFELVTPANMEQYLSKN